MSILLPSITSSFSEIALGGVCLGVEHGSIRRDVKCKHMETFLIRQRPLSQGTVLHESLAARLALTCWLRPLGIPSASAGFVGQLLGIENIMPAGQHGQCHLVFVSTRGPFAWSNCRLRCIAKPCGGGDSVAILPFPEWLAQVEISSR